MQLNCTTEVAGLCNREAELVGWAGPARARSVKRLLCELAAANTLAVFAALPYALVVLGAGGRAAAHGSGAGVLLEPDTAGDIPALAATAVCILAVSAGALVFNPEGAEWPKLSPTSQTTE